MGSFLQYVGGQAERQKAMYSDMVGTAQRIPSDFEWRRFVKRNGQLLIDPESPPRSVDNISFPNQNHRSTKALIEGLLERKSGAMGAIKGYSTGYYALTPSKFLHEFKSDDDFRKEPMPELSLYLPDCSIGAVNGDKFIIKGKDVAKGKVGAALSISHDYNFKAHSAPDAEKWWNTIRTAAGAGAMTGEMPGESEPNSPVESSTRSATQPPSYRSRHGAELVQTEGLPKEEGAYPQSAGGAGTKQHYISPTGEGGVGQEKFGHNPPIDVDARDYVEPQTVAAPNMGGNPMTGAQVPHSGVERVPGHYSSES